MLRLITTPTVEAGVREVIAAESGPSATELNWLYGLQQMNKRTPKRTSSAEAAVDEMLATYS